MCGRYALKPKRSTIVDEFKVGKVADLQYTPSVFGRYNIAPTQAVAVVVPSKEGRLLTAMRWGLIPGWMKPKEGNKAPSGWINARSETASTKPAFRGAFRYRRCIVPASGFYEWQKLEDGSKQPWLMRSADEKTMGFAGLWETWMPPDGSELDTVTILTTSPNSMMEEIHDRMPVILDPDHWDRWMTTEPAHSHDLEGLLAPTMDGTTYKTMVSRRVNNVRNDDAACENPMD